MGSLELLETLRSAGAAVWVEGEELHIKAPRGALTPELRRELAARKAELVALLSPEVPPWSGQRVKIEDLPAFKEKWGLRVVSITWPEDEPCPVATFVEVAADERA